MLLEQELVTSINEPRHEKTCLQGCRPGKIQTSLCRAIARGLKFRI